MTYFFINIGITYKDTKYAVKHLFFGKKSYQH